MAAEQDQAEMFSSVTKEFLAGLPALLGSIESSWAQTWREGIISPALDTVLQHVHSLTGSAAALGFNQISAQAHKLQEILGSIERDQNGAEDTSLAEAESAMQSLRKAIYTDQQIDLEELSQRMGITGAMKTSLHEKRAERCIYLVEDDPIQAAELADQVGYFGYCVQVFHSPNDLEQAVARSLPTAILMDVSFPDGAMKGYETIVGLRDNYPELPPIIYITVHDRMPFRLQAVRVGGKAYFTKPVDVGALIDVLDRIIFHDINPISRVLIVDDSRVQAKYIATLLENEGITTETVFDPLQVLNHMISFNPDLLLLDMYMPGCTGMELAGVIRQMEQFISVPIVFLSAETDKEKQQAAMGLGGDDFLTKPIEPQHLISSVKTRIERYRKLRGLMIQDGLTGLLNHRTVKERLTQEIERARRQKGTLSLAMIDLDHFKLVNDSYGHATGDRVLRSIAHMLKQRLRSTDTIGRYGGEEFAVIFPDTDEYGAARIMTELCESFAKIHHYSGDQEFNVTFSCGVASSEEYDSAGGLSNAADAALYAAKTAGRNRVCLASQLDHDMQSQLHPHAPPHKSSREPRVHKLDRQLLQGANCVVIGLDREANITFINDFAKDFFGYSEDEIIGKSILGSLVPQTDTSGTNLESMIADIVANPDRYVWNENQNLRKNGEKLWMGWSNTPILDRNGELLEIICIGNDLTASKRVENDLHQTVTYLSALNRILHAATDQEEHSKVVIDVAREVADLFNAQHVGVSILTQDGSALDFIGDSQEGWNEATDIANRVNLVDDPASQHVVQTRKATFVNDAMHNPLVRGSHALLEAHGIHNRMIAPLTSRNQVIGTMNIDFEEVERCVSSIDLELAESIGVTIASVLENSRLFNAEQRQREYFEALVNNIPVAVVIIDNQAKIGSWNPAAQKLFGYTKTEAIGQHVDELLSSAEYSQEANGFTQDVFKDSKVIHAVTRRTRKDGSLADVELFAIPVFVDQVHTGSMAIYHDISDLQQARREAEAANQAKSSFLATMSHEIRTPLNAIVGMTTLLLDTHLDEEQREFSETIRGSSDALLTIINDILDFSKIEAGRMELEEQAFDLRECVESALDLVAGKATEKGIDLAYLYDPDVPNVIISDSTRLRQILLNLLSNALKFTEDGEVVLTISAEQLDGGLAKDYRLHFSVRDTGIGIPTDRMELLFRSFSQLDTSTTRKYGGTGLGLAISRRLAKLMGGEMWVESEGIPGKGSIFHFMILTRKSTSPIPVFLNLKQPELSGKRVLIVDDNATNRYILMRQVRSWGMDSQETADPRQALEWIREGKQYDLALLDMQMPDMDGAALAAEITARFDGQPPFPLVMLTSLGMKDPSSKALPYAAYLTKPIKPAVLYKKLLEVFNVREKTTQIFPSTPPALEKKQFERKQLRILLAEDTVVNQKVGLLLLKKIGYRADIAGNGLEVLEALRRQPYDVILMDVQMPEMDGLETTKRVRSGVWQNGAKDSSFNSQPYIVAMTANAMQGDRERCLSVGMDDYISKPINIEELDRALKAASLSFSAPPAAHAAIQVPPLQPQVDGLPVLDEEVIQRFSRSLGLQNASTEMAELIFEFLGEAPQLIEQIHDGLQKNDFESVRRGSHSLRSSSLLFGAMRLAGFCKSIETAADNHDMETAESLLENVRCEFERVETALRSNLEEKV